MPTISVVIPCLNEEKYIGKLLESLACQTAKADEVLVADSYSDDQTVNIVSKFKDRLPLHLVKSINRSPGAARNAGAKKASGEYLLFIDADITIPANFIETIKNYLQGNPVDFITPKYKSDGGHMADSLLFWMVNSALFLRAKILKRLFGIGGVMCVRKSLHEQVGGFDPKRQAHNDLDYINKLKREKPSFAYLDQLVVVHSSRRYHKHNLVTSLLTLVRENTIIGFLIQPFLQKTGRGKKYGRHN